MCAHTTRLPPVARTLVAVSTITLSALVLSCEQPISRDFFPQPPEEEFLVAESAPSDGEQQVPRNLTIAVRFTSRPDPDTLSELSVTLRADGQPVPVDLRVNLVDCEAVIRPVDSLGPGVTHQLDIDRAVRSLRGDGLDQPFQLTFSTGDATADQPPPTPVSNQEVWDQVFNPQCGCCHSPQNGAYRHVLALEPGFLAHQPSRQIPSRVLVEPGRHEDSYLVHKVLGLPTIEGEPMPPPGLTCASTPWPADRDCAPGDALVDLLARWIDTMQF